MTIDYLTCERVRDLIEPDVAEEGLTIDQSIAEGAVDTLTDAHVRDLWLLYWAALVEG